MADKIDGGEATDDGLEGLILGKTTDTVDTGKDDGGAIDGDHDAELDGDEDKVVKKKAKAADHADLTVDDDEPEAGADGEPAGDAADDDAADNAAEDAEAALTDDEKATRAKFSPDQQKRFDNAIQKRAAKLKTAREELATVKATLAEREAELETAQKTPAARAVPTAANPLADVETEVELTARIADARALRRFALANPDGAWLEKSGKVVEEADIPEGKEGDYTQVGKKKIGLMLADTEELLNEHAPARRNYLQQRETADAEAVKVHPWLKAKDNAGTVAIEARLRKNPQLRSVPGIRLILADAHVTSTARKVKAAAGGGGDDKPRKAPINPGQGGQRPAKAAAGKVVVKAQDRVRRTGQDSGNVALHDLILGSRE